MYIYGYNRNAEGIPLTRSKQVRNLKELTQWVQRPLDPLSQFLQIANLLGARQWDSLGITVVTVDIHVSATTILIGVWIVILCPYSNEFVGQRIRSNMDRESRSKHR